MVEQIIFRDVAWINGASHNQFSSHGTTVDHLNKIDEVLLRFKASDKLGMIRRPGGNEKRGKDDAQEVQNTNKRSVGSLCAHFLYLYLVDLFILFFLEKH